MHLPLPSIFSDQSLEESLDIHSDIANLLHTYQPMFARPSGLPPTRPHNHAIPLQKGVVHVKVKPYIYPFSQKQQIEKVVQEMLQESIIIPSNSSFSSPIIFVKKKNNTWRFCTDYRALNVIAVKDSFPIPTVDELIDELHDVQYFSQNRS